MDINNATRAQLLLKRQELRSDITFINNVISRSKGESVDGLESLNPETVIQQVVEAINKEQGIAIAADVAGLEGFVDKMKEIYKTVSGALKIKPSKQSLTKVKQYITDASKAADFYKSNRWIEEQSFKGIGKATFVGPPSMEFIGSVEETKKVFDELCKAGDNQMKVAINLAKPRLVASMKIFDKFSGKESNEENIAEANKLFPIKPAYVDFDKESLKVFDLGGKNTKLDIPVLKKDEIKEIAELMKRLVSWTYELEIERENLIFDALSYEDLDDDAFWCNVHPEMEKEMSKAVEWHYIDENGPRQINTAVSEAAVRLAQFLENWILHSVK